MIDLRSDTVTKPTPGMRAAMAQAPVGDDVFHEDPTVNRLQEKVAALASLEGAKAKLKRIKEGDREEDRRSARAELEAAQVDLRLAQEEFDRTERAFRRGASSTTFFWRLREPTIADWLGPAAVCSPRRPSSGRARRGRRR